MAVWKEQTQPKLVLMKQPAELDAAPYYLAAVEQPQRHRHSAVEDRQSSLGKRCLVAGASANHWDVAYWKGVEDRDDQLAQAHRHQEVCYHQRWRGDDAFEPL